MFKQILPQEFALVKAREMFAEKFPHTVQTCAHRLENATRIARAGYVYQNGSPYAFIVRSEHGAHIYYSVDRRARSCDCYDRQRGNLCKHIFAVWLALRAQEIWQGTLEVERDLAEQKYGRATISLGLIEAQEVREEIQEEMVTQ